MTSRGEALRPDTGMITDSRAAAPGLDIEVSFAPAGTVLCLRGELDAANVRALDDALGAVILPRATGDVVVDTAGLRLCDAAGAAAVAAACDRLEELGLRVSRRGP